MQVYLKHGFPQLWPFSFAAIKQYMVPVSAMTDFQYALLSIVFLTAKPILLIMVPIVSLAVYHFFAYASKHYGTTGLWQKYGAGAHRWLIEHQVGHFCETRCVLACHAPCQVEKC